MLHHCVLFLGVLLILDAILLFPQTDAENAVFTAHAITEEPARMTIYTFLRTDESVTPMDINAVVAEFAMKIVKTIHASNILLESVTIVAILAEIRMHDEVAIFRGTSKVNIFTVDKRPLHITSLRRNDLLQCSELLEERLIKINVPPI